MCDDVFGSRAPISARHALCTILDSHSIKYFYGAEKINKKVIDAPPFLSRSWPRRLRGGSRLVVSGVSGTACKAGATAFEASSTMRGARCSWAKPSWAVCSSAGLFKAG